MAELLPSVLPLKKRKIKTQSPDQESSCRQGPVSLFSSTELLLQIPPNTNTSLPVWEFVKSALAEVQWSETPYSITIQITPLITQKARSNDQPASQTSSLSETKLSTLPVKQPQPPCQFEHPPLPVCLLPSLSGLGHNCDMDCPSASFELAAKTFYTKPSKYTHICDDFLTGCCPYKLSCEQHHTPFPFHWQLRHRGMQHWFNISLCAQVKLEKLYCDPDQETIRLQDMAELFTLHLGTKKVTSVKYDKARRLSSSHDPEMSPHFPTEWSIYWRKDDSWEKYDKDVSKQIQEAIEAEETSHGFYIGEQHYKVDFSSMTQMNLTTKFKRRIRWRPTFCPPFSIISNLKTVSVGESPRPFGQVLRSLSVDPLQEFSSWYPPVWTLGPDQGFSLVEVPLNAKAYQSIHCLFHSTVSETKTEIISIQQVQNIFQWDKYRRQKEHMQSHSIAERGCLERHLFHGTTEVSLKEICLNNFDPRMSGKNGVVYGRGSYFARDARYSNKYARASGGENCQHMFLANVLVGKMTIGKTTFRRPPRINLSKSGYELYDTCVDQKKNPSTFVVFDSCQCYPYYLIKYKAVSDTVKIFE